jgi:hypothetical protein
MPPQIFENAQDLSSIRLPDPGITYIHRCFKQRILVEMNVWSKKYKNEGII